MIFPKVFDLSMSENGINETFQDYRRAPFFRIFCDALFLTNPQEGSDIAKEFERVIKKFLYIHQNHLDERLLKKTIDHAQKYFFQNYAAYKKNLKISVLILARIPLSPGGSDPLYVAGVGDMKLFSLSNTSELLFYDSENPKIPSDLTLQKRFRYLNNALGLQELKIPTFSLIPKENTNLLLAPYGGYRQWPEEKSIDPTIDLASKKKQLIKMLKKTGKSDHFRHLTFVSFVRNSEPRECPSPSSNRLSGKSILFQVHKKKIFPSGNRLLKISVILTLCILGFEAYRHIRSSPPSAILLPENPLSEPRMQLPPESLKYSFLFPFFKERAYVVDLKEKYERQTLIIDKLNQTLREQDKTLRDLQVKSYYPSS